MIMDVTVMYECKPRATNHRFSQFIGLNTKVIEEHEKEILF
jgi:hypothetical protein